MRIPQIAFFQGRTQRTSDLFNFEQELGGLQPLSF